MSAKPRLPKAVIFCQRQNRSGSGGIRTHASEETGALNQRLRPLGHATLMVPRPVKQTFFVDFELNVN